MQNFIEICWRNLELLHIYQIEHFVDIHNPAYVFWTCPSKKWNIETMLTFPYSYNLTNVNNNKMNEKRSQEYQSMDPQYVTGQINSCILELLLRQFCCLIFAPSHFPNNYKRYSSHLQVLILHEMAPIKVLLPWMKFF